MENTNLKNSFVWKVFCMLILPIILLFTIISGLIVSYTIAYPEVRDNNSFYETKVFGNEYKNRIISAIHSKSRLERTEEYITVDGETDIELIYSKKLELPDMTIFYETVSYYDTNDGFEYLVVDTANKKAYTNVEQTVKTDTIEKIKEEIGAKELYWSKEDENVTTNMSKLSYEEIKYGYVEEVINQQKEPLLIYTGFNTGTPISNGIITEEIFYQFVAKYNSIAYYILPIALILLIITTIYLVSSCGHKKGEKEITLDWFDKIPLEIYGFVAFWIYALEVLLVWGTCYIIMTDVKGGIYLFCMASYLFLITALWGIGSIIKRVKSHTFIKNTIIYRIWKWFRNKVGSAYRTITSSMSTTFKLTILFGGFLIISIILIFGVRGSAFWALVLIAFWTATFMAVLRMINQFNKIKEAIKSIYEGKTDIRLNENELKGVLQELAIYINDIAGGFSNAIEESLKSERLKTELITNVSHDIKTPLTSIINYVDLLKQENIEDEKIKEYLEVLDNKSQRLKKLIEDLVEASKASSGNIKLVKEKLNVKELLKQINGEFSDKFQQKGLEVIMDMPEEDIYIVADNRYMYRVIENLYSNISKYALDNSRVYIDMLKNGEHIIISIKNISKEQLNISVDELMQRFVRGDKARNTEGSGLGLSIAQSLVELQGGHFAIYLDGDLFKVVIEF